MMCTPVFKIYFTFIEARLHVLGFTRVISRMQEVFTNSPQHRKKEILVDFQNILQEF